MSAGDWQERAACRDHPDPDLFFDTDPLAVRQAMAVCAVCPVTGPCLELAIDELYDDGVWGGLSGEQRRSLLRTGTRRTA